MNSLTGGKYEGEYLDNWYHGNGKFTFDNGISYEGQFYHGDFHGEGLMRFPNGG